MQRMHHLNKVHWMHSPLPLSRKPIAILKQSENSSNNGKYIDNQPYFQSLYCCWWNDQKGTENFLFMDPSLQTICNNNQWCNGYKIIMLSFCAVDALAYAHCIAWCITSPPNGVVVSYWKYILVICLVIMFWKLISTITKTLLQNNVLIYRSNFFRWR